MSKNLSRHVQKEYSGFGLTKVGESYISMIMGDGHGFDPSLKPYKSYAVKRVSNYARQGKYVLSLSFNGAWEATLRTMSVHPLT